MIDQPTAEDALKALEPLVGEWTLNAVSPGSGSVTSCPFGSRCGRATDQWLARACLGSQNTAVHAAARNPTATSSA